MLQRRLLAKQLEAREAQQALHDHSQLCQQRLLNCAAQLDELYHTLAEGAMQQEEEEEEEEEQRGSSVHPHGANAATSESTRHLLQSNALQHGLPGAYNVHAAGWSRILAHRLHGRACCAAIRLPATLLYRQHDLISVQQAFCQSAISRCHNSKIDWEHCFHNL